MLQKLHKMEATISIIVANLQTVNVVVWCMARRKGQLFKVSISYILIFSLLEPSSAPYNNIATLLLSINKPQHMVAMLCSMQWRGIGTAIHVGALPHRQ
jgi:hypothetical protein